MHPDIRGLLVGIIGSIVYDLIKRWFTTNFSDINDNNLSERPKYRYKVASLKRQFYICFPVGLASEIISYFVQNKEGLLYLCLKISFGFCMFFVLSAFMCAIDEIKYFENNISDYPSQNDGNDKI